MKPIVAILCGCAGLLLGAAPPAKTTKQTTKRSTKKIKKVVRRPVQVSAAARAAARDAIDRRMAAVTVGVEYPEALRSYFAALDHATEAGRPVHILQFGDSHTASDDWVNAMRMAAQSLYGNGGPGYIHAGHPFLGYRRFDASGANSTGWKTDGNKSRDEDPNQGLSHVSISTSVAGQTVRLAASGESIGIFYMTQPGGGQLELTCDGETKAIISTGGDAVGPGYFSQNLTPGHHEVTLRTMNFAPVRLFGWTLDNSTGVTFETLGINGALASKILDANEQMWASEIAQRSPALIILAFGTNEANSHLWTADQYRADLTEIIVRIRRAAPGASILLVGPPDCGKIRPLLHLSEVIDIQREIALKQGVAFWDWRMHMGGDRIVNQWVLAGLSQADYIHLTGEGYRLIGNMLFAQMEKAHSEGLHD
jgi:lysophospholipase L1-like esterase